MKISSFMIGLVVVGLIATTFTMTLLNLSTVHSVEYDEETLAIFANTEEINNLSLEIQSKTNTLNTESGILDVVGLYISKALDALKLSAKSLDVFENMAASATDKIGLPAFFLTGIITIVLILIIIAVMISAMVKRDL
jgi:hypothetical protein